MTVVFPEFETLRLKLRILTLEDTEAVYTHFSDEQVTRYMDIEACRERREAEAIIRFHLADTGCRWGIFDKYDDRLIGTCGYHCWVQGPPPRAELGFDLAQESWGKGIMQEALKPVIEFGFDAMGLGLIEATVEQENSRSLKLLQTLNFERAPELKDGLIYFELPRK